MKMWGGFFRRSPPSEPEPFDLLVEAVRNDMRRQGQALEERLHPPSAQAGSEARDGFAMEKTALYSLSLLLSREGDPQLRSLVRQAWEREQEQRAARGGSRSPRISPQQDAAPVATRLMSAFEAEMLVSQDTIPSEPQQLSVMLSTHIMRAPEDGDPLPSVPTRAR